ncbi:hypothetical protein J3R83DRAFT_14038 [Lanmaoa asiatica]|nr:hypothetical protein J3R83DRAFT_14038 [Lanmaoa asiatica]
MRPLDSTIARLEQTVQQLRTQHANSQHRADSLSRILRAHEQKHQCETLYAEGRIMDAALSLLEIINTVGEEVRTNNLLMDWFASESPCRGLGQSVQFPPLEFMNQCVSMLEQTGDEALNSGRHDEAVATYSTALLLSPSTPSTLVIKWASTVLIRGSANEALITATKVCVT